MCGQAHTFGALRRLGTRALMADYLIRWKTPKAGPGKLILCLSVLLIKSRAPGSFCRGQDHFEEEQMIQCLLSLSCKPRGKGCFVVWLNSVNFY